MVEDETRTDVGHEDRTVPGLPRLVRELGRVADALERLGPGAEDHCPTGCREDEAGGPLARAEALDLLWGKPDETLARLRDGDPLWIGDLCVAYVESRALMLQLDRVYERALLKAAVGAVRYEGTPPLDEWLQLLVAQAAYELLAEVISTTGEGDPTDEDWELSYYVLAGQLGVETAEARRMAIVVHVHLAVVAAPVLARVVRPLAGVVDQVRRVGRAERRPLAAHDPRRHLGVGAVAAEQQVLPEPPEVDRPGDWVRRGLPRSGVLQILLGLEPAAQVADQPVDLALVEADPGQGLLGAQALQQAGQGLLVPLGQFARAVQGDPEGRALRVREVELDHVALLPAELAHADQAAVAADHAAGPGLDHQRLGLAEAGEARSDGLEVLLAVGAGVGRVLVDAGQGDAADGEAGSGVGLGVQVRAPRRWGPGGRVLSCDA